MNDANKPIRERAYYTVRLPMKATIQDFCDVNYQCQITNPPEVVDPVDEDGEFLEYDVVLYADRVEQLLEVVEKCGGKAMVQE